MDTIKIPHILLPDVKDMRAWAVNACDQFTSDRNYWLEVERETRDKPSSYNLIFPEIYLKDEPEKRIERINENMRAYLSGGVFKGADSFVLVERHVSAGVRRGVLLAIDLEDYSYFSGATCPVRSTEETVPERIPPRVRIRERAPLELPHVMLLYNDPDFAVEKSIVRGETLYDFDLMLGGGRVKGTLISNPETVRDALYATASDGLLFAVGDGNHSLATAKTCWDKVKADLSPEERENHPARFALAEAVNIYDDALTFEPIHRLVKTDAADEFLKGLETRGKAFAYTVTGGERKRVPFDENIPRGIRELDNYISRFLKEHGGEVDYIHGDKELAKFTKSGGAGVLLPAIKKENFFALLGGGVLPRKTFSMGEGNEKRYYIEAKMIV